MTEIVWKCHISERFLYPFVCLSVCLSVTITLYVWRAACRIAMSETAHDFTINDADRDTVTTTLYVRHVDGSLSDDVRLLCMDGRYSARCHIPEGVLHPSTCLSVCLSVTTTLCVWRAGSQCQRQHAISQCRQRQCLDHRRPRPSESTVSEHPDTTSEQRPAASAVLCRG